MVTADIRGQHAGDGGALAPASAAVDHVALVDQVFSRPRRADLLPPTTRPTWIGAAAQNKAGHAGHDLRVRVEQAALVGSIVWFPARFKNDKTARTPARGGGDQSSKPRGGAGRRTEPRCTASSSGGRRTRRACGGSPRRGRWRPALLAHPLTVASNGARSTIAEARRKRSIVWAAEEVDFPADSAPNAIDASSTSSGVNSACITRKGTDVDDELLVARDEAALEPARRAYDPPRRRGRSASSSSASEACPGVASL